MSTPIVTNAVTIHATYIIIITAFTSTSFHACRRCHGVLHARIICTTCYVICFLCHFTIIVVITGVVIYIIYFTLHSVCVYVIIVIQCVVVSNISVLLRVTLLKIIIDSIYCTILRTPVTQRFIL